MAEILTLLLFVLGIAVCVALGTEIVYALLLGLVCFVCYALYKKYSPAQIWKMMLEGVIGAKIVLIVFALIGMLTAVWRCSGTIPFIIYNSVELMNPRFFVLSTFLLCSLMSMLTGTSFGTAGTMGVICMMMAKSLGISPLYVGGAILSGAFFGDRCSPMSSSAMTVCSLTDTDIYGNLKNMMKSGAIPFLLTCAFYLFFGSDVSQQAGKPETIELFTQSFNLSWLAAIPAAVIIILLMFRANVRVAMLMSIAAGCIAAIALQGVSLTELLKYIVFGYSDKNAELAQLINGGGLVSMIKVSLIITISSCYSGIFRQTGLLNGVKNLVKKGAEAITPFGSVMIVSIFLCMISCNQLLATMLTSQMAQEVISDKRELALTLEDTSIVIAPLVPWSIAGAVPVATVGAPMSCLFFAAYLYFLPLCGLLFSLVKKAKK